MFCYKMITSKYFEDIILGLIVLSSIKLAFDTYWTTEEQLEASSDIDYCFNLAFAIEMSMKVITYGLVFDDDAYL
jgi:Ion transport protein